jgi:hypothetical protein
MRKSNLGNLVVLALGVPKEHIHYEEFNFR